MKHIGVNIRYIAREMNAPDGLCGVEATNAGLASQLGVLLAHPVDAELSFSSAALELNDLTRLQHDIKSREAGRNLCYVQCMGKLAFSAAADDGDRKHHLSAKLTPV